MRNGTVLSREAKSEPPASVKDQPSFQEEARTCGSSQTQPGKVTLTLPFTFLRTPLPTPRLGSGSGGFLLQSGNKDHAEILPPAPLPAPPDRRPVGTSLPGSWCP